MILRKPYAFLIKHFKLIHMIITIFMAISLYKLFAVISFFGDYVVNESSIVGQTFSDIVYPTIVFVSPFIIIALSLILLGVMIVKKKPFVLYIVNIVIYILLLVVLFMGNSVVVELQKALVDLRVVKMIRDFTTMLLIVQIYPLSKNFVRAIGFDIKQFDFKKDLAELEIKEEDNEEVEVSFSFDFNKLKRILNNGFRNFKYYYAEHKFIVNIVGGVSIVLLIGTISFGVYNTNKRVSYNKNISMNGLTIKVLNSYLTRLDSKGKVIENLGKKNSLLVVPITITNKTNDKKELVTANIELKIGNHKYRHISTYRDPIFDLGLTYQNTELAKDETINVNLVYEIPTKYINKKMMLKFITSIDESHRYLIPTYANLKIKYINLDDNITEDIINKGEEFELNDNILAGSLLTINNVELDTRFKINYNYCVSSKECIPSYEYLNAPLSSNTDRALMKINGNVVFDEQNKIFNIVYLYDLISKFGTIQYVINNNTKTMSTFTKVNPLATKSNNIIYISVPKEILDAQNIELILKIRNKDYKYVIK